MDSKTKEILKQTNGVFFAITLMVTIYNITYLVIIGTMSALNSFTLCTTIGLSIFFYLGMLSNIEIFKYAQLIVTFSCLTASLYIEMPAIDSFALIIIFYCLGTEYELFLKRWVKFTTILVISIGILLSALLHKQPITQIFGYFFLSAVVIMTIEKIRLAQYHFYINYMNRANAITEQVLAKNKELVTRINARTEFLYLEEKKREGKNVGSDLPVS